MPIKKQILIDKFEIEVSKDGKLHMIYVPDQTQILRQGVEYEFVIQLEKAKGRKANK